MHADTMIGMTAETGMETMKESILPHIHTEMEIDDKNSLDSYHLLEVFCTTPKKDTLTKSQNHDLPQWIRACLVHLSRLIQFFSTPPDRG